MAVTNSIAPQKALDPMRAVEYTVAGESVKLSPAIVRNYLTSGNGNITDQEIAYFINMCKYQKLNALTKEVYLVKYGSQPAAIIIGKDALLKRAMRNPQYRGHEAGVIVRSKETRQLEYRVGTIVLPEEELIGGWAKTYVEGYKIPIEATVAFREYAGTKSDGSLNSMWAGKPGTMIRKVALVASLREAFPEDLGGMYAAEEVHTDSQVMVEPPVMDIPPMPAQDIDGPFAETGVDPEPMDAPEQMNMEDIPTF